VSTPRDLVLFLPGITGSVLESERHGIVWDQSFVAVLAGLKDRRLMPERLGLPPSVVSSTDARSSGIRPRDVIRRWHVWPGISAGSGYDPVLLALSQLHGVEVRLFHIRHIPRYNAEVWQMR
jgi:hypothetical protein